MAKKPTIIVPVDGRYKILLYILGKYLQYIHVEMLQTVNSGFKPYIDYGMHESSPNQRRSVNTYSFAVSAKQHFIGASHLKSLIRYDMARMSQLSTIYKIAEHLNPE